MDQLSSYQRSMLRRGREELEKENRDDTEDKTSRMISKIVHQVREDIDEERESGNKSVTIFKDANTSSVTVVVVA